MNILFITENIIIPTIGGIERVSYSLAQGLKDKGYAVFSAYIKEISYDKFTNNDLFVKYFHWDLDENSFINIINDNNINIIISQRQLGLEGKIRNAINQSNLKCLLFSVLHCRPGYEITDKEYIKFCYTKSYGLEKLKLGIKKFAYPLYKKYLQKLCIKNMHITWENSDKVILLSEKFKALFCKTYNIKEYDNKLIAINNLNSYEEYISENKIIEKDKTVIVVCRLEERSKRVSTILNIWNDIKNEIPENWKLQIIGTGPDEGLYKSMIQNLNIKNVEMIGYKNPLEYYKKASIITVVSANEGWGMVITEAMQMGVVPIVMDSYESLYDIIDNQINGFIVPNNDTMAFKDRLLYLMNNSSILREISKESIKKSHYFSVGNIVEKWDKLIKESYEK